MNEIDMTDTLTDKSRSTFYLKEGDSLLKKPISEDSEERLRLALEAADVAIWDWDLDTNIISPSENFARILTGVDSRFDGKYSTFLRMVKSEDRKTVRQALRDAITNAHYYDVEFRVIWPGENTRWMRIRGNVYLDSNGNPCRLMGTIHDKTERKLALDELQSARDTLEKRVHERTLELTKINERLLEEIQERKTLQKEIMEVSEMEQQRIGQDLHDSICQQIGGIVFLTGALYEKIRNDKGEEKEDLKSIHEHLNTVLKQTRNLSRGLFPIIGKGELMIALEDLALSMEELYNIKVKVKFERSIFFNDNLKVVHLFRIVQESLNNAVRHGRAKEIRISFTKKSGQVRCEIRDNGCGFPNNPNIRGLGLNIMRYRASIIGATFDIHSERDKGTSIIVILPADKKWRLNK